MTLHTVILEAFRDETGEIGLGLAGMRRDETTNAATGSEGGVMVAHDLLEHVNGAEQIGSIDDELEALGAMWFVRGQFHDLNRYRQSRWSTHENLSSDIVRMFRDHAEGDQYVDGSVPRTRPCDADRDFADVLDIAARDYPEEFSDSNTRELRAMWRKYRRACMARLRIGYRKAARKYKGAGASATNRIFWRIADAVNPKCGRVELYEGEQFELVYGFDRHGEPVATCAGGLPGRQLLRFGGLDRVRA